MILFNLAAFDLEIEIRARYLADKLSMIYKLMAFKIRYCDKPLCVCNSWALRVVTSFKILIIFK